MRYRLSNPPLKNPKHLAMDQKLACSSHAGFNPQPEALPRVSEFFRDRLLATS